MVDRLTEERAAFVTKTIVVNVDWSPLALMDHENRCNTEAVRTGKQNFIDDLGVVSKVAKEYTEILHHVVYVVKWIPLMQIFEGLQLSISKTL